MYPRQLNLSTYCGSSMLCLLLALFTAALVAQADEAVRIAKHGLLDITCDERLKVVVIGDSIVYGRGDLSHGSRGGYVSRLAAAIPGVSVYNQGKPGLNTVQLLARVSQDITSQNSRGRQIGSADYIILDAGRNDFFLDRSASTSVVRMKRILNRVRALSNAVIAVALMTPTKRSYQRPFIKQLNTALQRRNSAAFPVRLKFSALPAAAIVDQPDGIHPSPAGYDTLAIILKDYLKGQGQRDARSKIRQLGAAVASCR